jgi:glycosyltransferase involved in cell wall biosynthesis
MMLSAFALGPGQGSEAGGAWRWAVELSKTREVVVVTDISRRPVVEPVLSRMNHPRLTVLYYRPWLLRKVPLNSLTAQVMFGCWQMGLLGFARRLHRGKPFELMHHISYGVFRQASWLGFVGPTFVFGPVGGGEDAPWRFKKSLPFREKLHELARAGYSWIATHNPLWRWAINKADVVITRTPETMARLPRSVQAHAFVAQETGAPVLDIQRATPWTQGEPIALMFAGRLLGWKGSHFAVMALAELRRRGVDARLTIIGSGPMWSRLQVLSTRLGLDDRLTLSAHVPQQELFECYGRAHVFVFPSLHDAGGNVVQEALAAGVPVVCFKLGGPPSFVDASCGEVVEARDAADEQALVVRLADAIERVTSSSERWMALHQGALARAADMTWEQQIARIQTRVGEILERQRLGDART